MSYFYDEETGGLRWINIVSIIIILLVLFFMYTPFVEKFEYNRDELYCEVTSCLRTTLDSFENCIDLGVEDTGFLSSNHYYLCDGVKVTNACLEYGKKEFEGENLLFAYGSGLECEENKK